MPLELSILQYLIPNNDVYLQLARFMMAFGIGIFATRFLLVPAVEKLTSKKTDSKKTKHQIHNIFLIIGLFISLLFGLQAGEFGNIVTVIGTIAAALTVAIGFGMRDEVGNIVSGIIIHLNSPFIKGDYVSVAEEEGVVKEVTLSSTKLNGHSSDRISVPNSKVRGGSVKNYTRGTKTKSSISMNTDPSEAEEIADLIKQKAKENGEALENPEPDILFRQYQDGKLNFEVHYWIKDSSDAKKIKSDIIESYNREAKEKGLMKAEDDDEGNDEKNKDSE